MNCHWNCITSTKSPVSGTGTVDLEKANGLFFGYMVYADGTNAVTVTLKDRDSGGSVIHQVVVPKAPPSLMFGPFKASSDRIYFSISGTNGTVLFFQAIPL